MSAVHIPRAEIDSALEALQGRRLALLHFPPILEQAFEDAYETRRVTYLTFLGLLGLGLYDSFLFVDYFCIPAQFIVSVIVRLVFVSPLSLFLLFFFPHLGRHFREAAFVVFTFPGAAGVLYLFHATPELTAYSQTALLLLLMYSNLMARSRFSYACAATLAFLLGDTAFLLSNHALAFPQVIVSASLLWSGAGISLFVKHYQEKEERIGYLLQMKSESQKNELSALNAELARLSAIDPLTGVPNRRTFEIELAAAWEVAAREHHALSLLMCDLDHFKELNDLYGHLHGDVVLSSVAQTIRESLRHHQDVVARFGGEEFVAILPDCLLSEALKIAERIRREVESLLFMTEHNHVSHSTTISIGAASVFPSVRKKTTELLEAADAALYEAKSRGRNRIWPQDRLVRMKGLA